ncbi:hypothetical protein Nepgr_029211 [Nepenthes gracilis]|uniref:Bromo domain-containing protein n=1 Tax=Nepenthes gracilis TaxID=150966 RepID=A0AAD3TDT2_NEPGR|nr:hypothetical protein Nepgr_029211 [Nepenthes gracilis]
MGKAPVTTRTKKKGRPSRQELQKRALHQQQQQLTQVTSNLKNLKNPKHLNQSPIPTRRSTRRDAHPGPQPSPAEEFSDGSDDDEERREKKVKLVVRLPFDDQVEKVWKATDSRNGLAVESGPTTPLPDKKLLVFILDRLQKNDTRHAFAEAVDPEELPDYHEVIEKPMDFGTVRKKLNGGLYKNLEQLEADVLLICSNAMRYNAPHTIYYKQARSIQELAKNDFENLKQGGGITEPPPKARRGRPPGRSLKKSLKSSPANCVGPSLCKFHPADRFNRASDGHRNVENCFAFPDSALKGLSVKVGRKQHESDDNRRDTYKQYVLFASGHDPSALTVVGGENRQLIAVGFHSDHCYARSLARFAANLGPLAWKIASRKIESVLPAGVKFGPGWVGETEALSEKLVCPHNSRYDSYMVKLLCTSTSSFANSPLANKSSMPSEMRFPEARGSNYQNEFALLNQAVGGTRPQTPYQIQHNSVVLPRMNRFNGSFELDFPSPGQASLPCQMPCMVNGYNTEPYSLEPRSLVIPATVNISKTESLVTDYWAGISADATEPGFQGKQFWEEVPVQERWIPSSIPSDLNMGLPASGSRIMLGSSPQLDLVLQL